MTRTLAWFSCGAASAVACKLMPGAIPVYCETHSEHPDNERFLAECERWFGREIIRLSSDVYADTWDVWVRRKYLSGVGGAPCTKALKVEPRLKFQRPDDVHVFGYTCDSSDEARARTLQSLNPTMSFRFPLIERGLDKGCVPGID